MAIICSIAFPNSNGFLILLLLLLLQVHKVDSEDPSAQSPRILNYLLQFGPSSSSVHKPENRNGAIS
ncbi:hypothetical protein SAY86_025920 [Trapa natans]|uniref:Uncharacterized protein n=1 Tax=Trapa natans TaxID=22666 RepID=A0AAN7KKU0_TRANT|nr:hypothetical protein SAY86_025920 [Trapa natans]